MAAVAPSWAAFSAITAAKLLTELTFFMLLLQQLKILLSLKAKLESTSILVFTKCIGYALLNTAFLFKFQRKLTLFYCSFWHPVSMLVTQSCSYDISALLLRGCQ